MKNKKISTSASISLMAYGFLNRGGISLEFANKIKSYRSKKSITIIDRMEKQTAFTLN